MENKHKLLFKSVVDEWNQAEEDIKLAEQVDNKVIIPAIKELRYAGRRIIDAVSIIYNLPNNAENSEKVASLIGDARFDCHRARHDAIDAATSKMALDSDIMIDKIGYKDILAAYPAFPNFIQKLNEIKTKIAESRKDRENREAIYSSIEGNYFPALVKEYRDLMGCEKMMIAMAKQSRSESFYGKWGFWFGIFGIIIGIVAWFFPK